MNFIPGFVETETLWRVAIVLFVVILAVAAFQDVQTQTVTNGLWLLSGVLWLVSALLTRGTVSLWEPLLFLICQESLFGRFYGRADCHAFSCCGFYLWGIGAGLKIYLMHMLLSILLLGIIQLVKRNVNTWGNLHRPVAFVPYILLGFCGILAWIWR